MANVHIFPHISSCISMIFPAMGVPCTMVHHPAQLPGSPQFPGKCLCQFLQLRETVVVSTWRHRAGEIDEIPSNSWHDVMRFMGHGKCFWKMMGTLWHLMGKSLKSTAWAYWPLEWMNLGVTNPFSETRNILPYVQTCSDTPTLGLCSGVVHQMSKSMYCPHYTGG